jgi:MFS transporter, MHS family, shikimate and dehydroshikimate transport protein
MTTVTQSAGSPGLDASAPMRRVIFASIIGSMIEWYDFSIYGTAAALVFNKLFFPTVSPLLGTLVAVATYGVGFLARPLGGALFGHFGDRFGRKKMLAATVLLMGGGTFLVGCLPTYDQIGMAAPILLILLRLVQGVGLGGEWGGAVLLMVENAPARRRGLFGSLVQSGSPFGILASVLAFNAVSGSMSDASFMAWGWRLPFLISLVLVVIGLWIRLRVAETAAFEKLRQAAAVHRAPLANVLSSQPGRVVTAVALKVSEISWAVIGGVFSIFYISGKLHMPRGVALEAVQLASLAQIFLTPFYGYLSDRVGRRPLYIGACLFSIAYAFPVFWLMDQATPGFVMLAVLIAIGVCQGVMFGVGAAYLSELFPTAVRYTGASLGFQIGAALSGGFTPIIAAALFQGSGGATWGISLYLSALAIVTLIATLCAPETAKEPLEP